MFKKDDYIIYASTGVCQIIDIRNEKFAGGETRQYYIINPIYANSSTIYAPVGNSEGRMKRVLSPDEALNIINEIPDEEEAWVEEDNIRRIKYSQIIREGDRRSLVKLIRTLHKKCEEKKADGKKFHSSDETLMKEAEKLLHEEFAHVFDIEPEDVVSFILNELSGPKK